MQVHLPQWANLLRVLAEIRVSVAVQQPGYIAARRLPDVLIRCRRRRLTDVLIIDPSTACDVWGLRLQSVEAGYARIPVSQDDSARMLGAGPLRLFAGVHLPLLGRSAGAAALLVFVDVMKELPATLVLRPFEAALPSLAIVAVGLVPVILLSRALRAR